VSPLASAPDPLLILILAIGLDGLVGDLPWLFRRIPHPVAAVGTLIGWLDRRLNRRDRPAALRGWLGALMAVGLVVMAAAAGVLVQAVTRALPWAWLFELFCVVVLLAQRSLFDHVYDVAVALRDNGVEAGRYAVSRLVGRDPASLDRAGVARAAIESLAENFSDAVVAPALAYALFGLPGLFVYKTVNTLDSMVGYRTERHRAFGMVSARLDDLLNLIPARVAALLLALAAPFVPGGRPFAALITPWRDARHHRSPNSGWPESACAGALGLALGGPRRYPGLTVNEKWMGRGRQDADARDVLRALHLFGVACLLDAGLMVLLLWLKDGLTRL
jgi:adenosylcobinamide-phosphate synthase